MCLNLEAAGSSKWYLYETMQHHIPEDHNLSIQHSENHRTHINQEVVQPLGTRIQCLCNCLKNGIERMAA